MKKLLPLIFLSLSLVAEEELSLDPNDIPLPTDSTMGTEQPSTPPVVDEFGSAPPVAAPVAEPAPSAPPAATQELNAGTPPAAPVNIEVPVKELTTKEEVQQPAQQPAEPSVPDNMKVRSSEVMVNQDPDQRLEEKFNRIYEQYNKSETSIESWEKVVGNRKAETYVVQKGDTLWDISRTLFGDPFFWPKIWALNKSTIYNPHEIDPKMNIKFYPGSEGLVPSLAMVNKKDATTTEEPPLENSKATPAKEEETDDKPQDRRIVTGTMPIPKSFPDYFVNSPKNEKKVILEERVNNYKSPAISLEFVMKESEIEPLGTISEMEIGSKTAATYQYVYVKLNDGNVKNLTVLKQPKTLKVPSGDDRSVLLYEVEGEIEVLNKVNSEENVYRAMVKNARAFVSRGSILVSGSMRKIVAEDGSDSSANQGQIIGNLNDNKLIAKNSFVVVDQGAQAGYTQGKIVPIFMNANNRNEGSIVTENQQKIGRMIIVDASENYSVGYVLKIFEQVYVKDFVGSNSGGSGAGAESAAVDSSLTGDSFSETTSDAPVVTEETDTTGDVNHGTESDGSQGSTPEEIDSGNF
jgi:hypothetical protein